MSIDPQDFKNAMSRWCSGVTVVTTTDKNNIWKGITASAFSSVSLNPPLVLVCITSKLYTHQAIHDGKSFAVNLLGTQHLEWGKIFAGMVEGVEDRFAGIECKTAQTGSPIFVDTLAWLDCELHHAYEGGDHTIFVGEVVASGSSANESQPLLYYNRQWGQFDTLG